ncbi:MAG: hypothetical protein WBJ21_12420, partial [Burkholderiaceae bacterium]
MRTVFATVFDAGLAALTGFLEAGLATTLLVFETAFVATLFVDLVAASGFGFAVAFVVVFVVAAFTATLLALTGERAGATFTAFA